MVIAAGYGRPVDQYGRRIEISWEQTIKLVQVQINKYIKSCLLSVSPVKRQSFTLGWYVKNCNEAE